MILIDRQGTGDKCRTEDWSVDGNELPHCWVVVRPYLELGVEVDGEEDETREGGGTVTRREGFERIINLLLITRADLAIIHDGS